MFVAGIEGSGHHALKSVWFHLRNENPGIHVVEYDQVLHSFGIENNAAYHYSSISLETHKSHIEKYMQQQGNSTYKPSIFIDAQNSYPMGMGAGSLAHPDVLMLKRLDGVLFDLRVIILQRCPSKSTLSSVRRFKKDDPRYTYKTPSFQARMVSESLAHLNNVLPSLPCGKLMVLSYEAFVEAPTDLAEPLAELLGLPVDHVLPAFADIKHQASSVLDAETQAIKVKLDEFFAQQSVLWPLLASARKP